MVNAWWARLESFEWSRWSPILMAGLRIVIILLVAWVMIALLQNLVGRVRARLSSQMLSADAARRAETLARVVRYLIALVVSALALMMVLAEVGISLAPILGAAGVVGLAIGFGAQSLVKDYFTGFFILFEDQIRAGDIVKIANIGGFVEDITLRHVRLRDYDGNVHFVPNGLITTVTNMTRHFAHAVMDVGVAYREDVDEVLAVMRTVAAEVRRDERLAPRILDDLEVAGVERWDASALVLRCRFKVAPMAQWDVRREYLRRLKRAFDAAGIEIAHPRLTVYAGADKQGGAAAMPVRLADTAT